MQSYNIRTDKGFLCLRVSSDGRSIQSEMAVLEKVRQYGVPVPRVILYEEPESGNSSYILVEEMKGEPIATKALHIFDYNRVLTQLAEILIRLHSVELYKFGEINSNLVGRFDNWQQFITKDLDMQIEYLNKSKTLPKSSVKKLPYLLHFVSGRVSPNLLHGNISTDFLFIDDKLKIATFSGFYRCVSGDPNFDLSGFLIYEDMDRAKRLVKSYYLQGGLVEWDSEELLKTSLRRAIGSLYFRHRNRKDLGNIVNTIVQLVARLKGLE